MMMLKEPLNCDPLKRWMVSTNTGTMETVNNQIKAEYDGYCAFAMSTGKSDVKGGKHQLTIEGKTYMFSNPIARMLFKILPNRVEKANAHWENR